MWMVAQGGVRVDQIRVDIAQNCLLGIQAQEQDGRPDKRFDVALKDSLNNPTNERGLS